MPSACPRHSMDCHPAGWDGRNQLQPGFKADQTGCALDGKHAPKWQLATLKRLFAFLLFRRSVNCSSMCEIIISISGLRILTAICVRSQQQRQQPRQRQRQRQTNLNKIM